jgi:hypothetical protein
MTPMEQAGRQTLLAARLRPGSATLIRFSPVLSLVLCLLGAGPAMATAAVETFGPGMVSCQILDGDQADCLLSASRITGGNGDEASFSLTALPPGEQASFRKWCLHPADECTVTIQGQRESPQATRLATVTSLQWRRPRAPRDQAAAAP